MNTAKDIAGMLLEIKAVGVRLDPPYTWSSGMKRPIYCDNRLIISYPEHRQKVIDGFKELIKEHNLEFDVIGGTASAAIPWAAFLAYEIGKPMVYIKKKSKGYGMDKLVEGHMNEGDRILIVEDLISTGGSATRAAEACVNQCKDKITGVIAIFTYEMQEAKQTFSSVQFPLYTLTNFHELIDVATEQKYLSYEDKRESLRWSENPKAWHDEYISKHL